MSIPRTRSLLAAVVAMIIALTAIAPVQAQAPAATAPKSKVKISESLLGYWAIDPLKMLSAMKEMAKKEEGKEEIDPAEIAMMKEMIGEMASSIVLEFLPNGVARVHSPDDEPDAKFTIIDADNATGKFSLKIEPTDEDPETAQASIDRKSLSLKTDEMELHFVRLTKERAKERIAEIEKEEVN